MRTGKHHDERPARPRDDQPGRGADRRERGGPARHHRLLAVGGLQRGPAEPGAGGEPFEDLRDPRVHVLVERQLRAGERRDHLARQVVGGRAEPAARDDEHTALVHRVLERPREVGRPVADDLDVRDLEPEVPQLTGHPGPVAVGDDPREQLASRDDHGGARPLP
ncbi:hypothetical protein BJF78_27555 [Pseudonocardia sp. CNS-139]|nr:hypothetical protein BJF78_27555 [Pseudonocardia sp. CNS-139]